MKWIGDHAKPVVNYFSNSAAQMIQGNYYTGKPTVLGTAGQIALGVTGLDGLADARDIIYDINHWGEQEHPWINLAIDAAALIPGVGAFKYADEVKDAVKPGVKNLDEVADGIKSGSNTLKNGATRAAQYSSEWGDASLQEAINKFTPDVKPVVTSKGKIIYNNPETGISVVYDKNGNYFRIEDTTRPRGRNYLDMDGNDMNNEIVNGKTRGRNRADYQRFTHFNNSDK